MLNVIVFLVAGLLGQAQPASPSSTTPLSGHQGQITVIDQAEVPAREMGVLKRLHVKEGETVEAGQLLAELDSVDAELAVRQARDELAIADAQARHEIKVKVAELTHAVAEAELNRAVESNKKFANAVSVTELEQLQLDRDRARAGIDEARYELSIAALTVRLKATNLVAAEQAFEKRKIYAPIPGQVVTIKKRTGEWIQPGEKLFQVTDSRRVRAECLLNAREFAEDLTDRPIRALLATKEGGPVTFEGRITFVDPEINPVSGQYRIWAELPNPDGRLRPGHRITLQLAPAPAPAPPPPSAQ